MLQKIRERATGWILWVIIILIGVPFAFFGVYNYFSGPSASVAAKVNDVEISLRALNNAYQQQRQRLEEIFGGQLDPAVIDEDKLRREALEQLINEAVLYAFVREQGFALSNSTLAAVIRSQDYFQADGRFSRERYELVLQRAGMTPAAYEAQVRRAEMIDQLQGGLYGSSLITEASVQRFVRLQRQQRELQYLVVPAEMFADQVEISADEVQAYYDEHPQRFRTPEQVRLNYVEVSVEQLMGQADIDEEAVRARYEELKETRFTEGGVRRVSHILIGLPEDASEQQAAQARQQIQEIEQKLAEGADFAELAKQYSEDPGSAESGGDLGVLEPGMMVEPFEKAAMALDEGEVSEPVRTRFGLHLIKATEVEQGDVQPFEEVREELAREMAEEQLANRVYELGNELANLAYEHPDSLKPAAEQLGLEVQQTGWLTREQGQGLGAVSEVREAAFSEEVLGEGRNSRLIELEDGRQVILRVAEHQPAQRQPLEAVEEQIRQQLRQRKASERAEALARELSEKLDGETTLQELATQAEQLRYVDAGYVRRGAAEHPRPVVEQAFRMPKPEEGEQARGHVQLPDGGHALISVSAVREGDPQELEEQQRQQVVQRLEALYGNAAISEFVESLREEADVVIYENRL